MRDPLYNLPAAEKQAHFDQLNTYKEQLFLEPELKNLFIEMTICCNEHCLHCGSSCGDIRPHDILTDQEIILALHNLKIQLQLHHKKPPFLQITGGEPLLRPHFEELMRRIYRLGYHWGMTSNGLLMTPEKARSFKEHGMYSVSISLDGTKATHDWFRQTPGGYEGALHAIDCLVEAGIPSVMVTTVVTGRSLPELDQIRDIVKTHHVPIWRIINIDPIGRALKNNDLLLDSEGYRRMFDYIVKMQDDPDLQVVYSCNHYLGLELERKTRSWYYFCMAGVQTASIQYNGDISACLDIERRPELVFGNIRRNSLYQVWNKSFGIYRTHKEETSSTCRNCAHKANCQGGGWHTWDFDRCEPRICMMKELGLLEAP